MSFIGDMFSSGKGAGFQAQGADLIQGATADQANQAYNQVQSGINQQQNFVNALQAQNGIGNQSNVFNQQQGLANQLQLQAQGQGPNPAMAQFNQATGQNVANQAALMASQRGTSANPGMMARQAAMQGANIQQQAAGQAGIMQAQQQLAAQQALQQQQGMMANVAGQQIGQQANATMGLNQAAQGSQANVLNSINAQNQNRIQNTAQMNQANAGVAQQNAGAQKELFSGALQGAGSAAMMLSDEREKKEIHSGAEDIQQFLDSLSSKSYEYKDSSQKGASPGKHVGVMAQDLEKSSVGKDMVKESPSGKKMVDYGQGMSSILAAQADLNQRLKALEHGPQHFAGGGMAMSMPQMGPGVSSDMGTGPASSAGQFLGNPSLSQGASSAVQGGVSALGKGIGAGVSALSGLLAPGVSGSAGAGAPPNLGVTDQDKKSKGPSLGAVPDQKGSSNIFGVASGKSLKMANGGVANLKEGGAVKGKAQVKGDSLKNDTVDAKLSPQEIVLPRSVTMSRDPAGDAAKFVAAILAKQGMKK